MKTLDKKTEVTKMELLRRNFSHFVDGKYDLMVGEVTLKKWFGIIKKTEARVYELDPRTGTYRLT